MKNFSIVILLLILVSCKNEKSPQKVIKSHNPSTEIPQMFSVLEAEDLYFEAAEKNRNGDYISARELLIIAIQYERNPIVYNEIGIGFLGERDTEKANLNFEEAVRLDSTYYPSHINLARCYLITSEFETGKKVLSNMIANCNSDYWTAYGNMYLALFYFEGDKNCPKALISLQKAHILKSDPALVKQYENLEKKLRAICGKIKKISKTK